MFYASSVLGFDSDFYNVPVTFFSTPLFLVKAWEYCNNNNNLIKRRLYAVYNYAIDEGGELLKKEKPSRIWIK